MNRFYLVGDCTKKEFLDSPEEVHHMLNVMRMKVGETFEIFDEKEQEYIAKIIGIDNNRVNYKLLKEVDCRRELPVEVTIYQGIPKASKMELILQKTTELGMSRLVPIAFDRCVVNLKEKEAKKIARWQKIVDEASKQSKRQRIPQVENVLSSKELKIALEENDLNILLYELEKDTSLQSVLSKMDLKDIKKIGIIIGPEGGLEAKEVALLNELKNTYVVTLGDRILRTETVGIYMMSVLAFLLEA